MHCPLGNLLIANQIAHIAGLASTACKAIAVPGWQKPLRPPAKVRSLTSSCIAQVDTEMPMLAITTFQANVNQLISENLQECHRKAAENLVNQAHSPDG